MKGIFELRSAEDLYAKLHADYARLDSAPSDSHVAFDFFVTAWHLTEWRFDTADERAAAIERHPVLRVCEHLAVGAKHFEPTSKRHDSVADTGKRRRGSWAPGAWAPGVWVKGFWGKQLTIELDGAARDHFGASTTAIALAERVMAAWEAEFRSGGSAS